MGMAFIFVNKTFFPFMAVSTFPAVS